MNSFKDRYGPVALVTGASSGIGLGFAEELAERGLDLTLSARRGDRLEALAERLEASHSVKVQICVEDLADPSAPARLLEETADLDVGLVISNAGFGVKRGLIETADPASLTDMLMVNCNAPMLLANGFIPRLRQRGKGGIVFTSSVEAMMGCPYSAGYSSSKAMVKALGEALWAELSGSGVDVLTLCPGATESEAAALQGVDMSQLPHLLSGREVARMTLDNLSNGPIFFSSEFYKGTFDRLLAMPRRDALVSMLQTMPA